MNTKAYTLTPSEIDFIISNTDFSAEQIQKWFAEFKMKCENCILNKEQFIQFYTDLMKMKDSKAQEYVSEFCEHVFNVIDADKYGYVDYGEFLVAFWVRSRGNLREKLSWLFDVYDVDRFGYLSQTKLINVIKLILGMKQIRGNVNEIVKWIYKKVDRNADGRLTKNDFIALCTQDTYLRTLFSPF